MTPIPWDASLSQPIAPPTVQHFLPILLAFCAPQDAPPQSYALLPVPGALSQQAPTGPERSPDGLPFWGPDEDPSPMEVRPPMPLEDWRRWIEEEAANKHRSLRLRSTGGSILVQGPAGEVAALQNFTEQVTGLLRALAIQVQVTVQIGEGNPVGQSGLLFSGGQLALGQVQQRGFVGSWRTEIASDSAVAEPEIWTAQTGWSLFLHGSRRPYGDELLLAGSFINSVQTGSTSFDPETPDLGLIEQPQLEFTRIDFARSLRPGSSIELELQRGGQTMRITVSAQWNPDLPRPGQWTVIETASLWPELPWIDESQPDDAWAPSSIAAVLTSAGLEGSPLWAGSLLLIPPEAKALESQAQQLISALGGAPEGSTLRAAFGTDGARLPTVAGLPVEVQMTHLTTAMTGYRAHLATDAWIAEPQVQTLIHGTTLKGRQRSGTTALGWTQRALGDRGLTRAPQLAYLGSLERIAEEQRSGTIHLQRGDSGSRVLAAAPHGEIHCQLSDDDSR